MEDSEFYFTGTLKLSLNFCYTEDSSIVKSVYIHEDGHAKTQRREFFCLLTLITLKTSSNLLDGIIFCAGV